MLRLAWSSEMKLVPILTFTTKALLLAFARGNNAKAFNTEPVVWACPRSNV